MGERYLKQIRIVKPIAKFGLQIRQLSLIHYH
jgi:hypothetical protein